MTAHWDRQLARFGESLRVLPQLVEGVPAVRLHRIPAPREWSAHVVVCHLGPPLTTSRMSEVERTVLLAIGIIEGSRDQLGEYQALAADAAWEGEPGAG